jgi:GTP cyclohydrolase IA
MESLLSQLRDSVQDLEERERFNRLAGAVRTMLECIGENPDREGLQDTPERYAKAMLFFTKGQYEESLSNVVNDALFNESHKGMVIVKNIDFSSLCEHHLLPFFGKVELMAPTRLDLRD